MTQIFDDAVDKNVAVTVLYVNDSDELFYNAEKTQAVPEADLLNLFVKGVVALKNGVYYKALSCSEDGSVIDFGFAGE